VTTNVPVDRMELHALAEPSRLLTILSERSHPDRAVRKQFRSSFGRYFDEYPVRFPLVASNCGSVRQT
jgi:hypothetical protein